MAEAIGVLVMAYGGPDKLADVEPYLLDVRGGRPLSKPVLEEVVGRYSQIGGRSPILERTQEQARLLQEALDRGDARFKVYLGMRHWHPYIQAAVEQAYSEGVRRLIGIVMAPHYSRMSIGAYYKRLDGALESLESPVEVARIESWNLNPGYLETLQARIEAGLERFPAQARPDVQLLYTAHSLPERILEWGDPYPRQLQETYDALRMKYPNHRSHFAYQSAAMTQDAWLGPEAGDLMLELLERGGRDFLVVPIGFVSEHVEILYDIDIDFRERVAARGGRMERIEMPGADPRLMDSLAGEIQMQAEQQGWL